jgi:CheY-like chemotaxis protein
MVKEILIADSDKANQKEFQKILRTNDYHLVFSESGEDVLLRVKLFKPDLIISGTALSEKNGFQLCEAIKSDPDFRSIPFILLLKKPDEISEKDRERIKADGILSKPLHESQVLNLVERLLEGMRPKAGGMPGRKMELESFADMGAERFGSNESEGKEEEEVIDLLEVVEEAESKINIDDFVIPEKAEPFGEMTSLDSWEKLGEEEKLAAEEGIPLALEGIGEEAKDLPYTLKKEVIPEKEPPPRKEAQEEEEELFEKIELEDILKKVGKIELPSEMEEPPQEKPKAFKEEPAPAQEAEEKPFEFGEFEMALRKGVEAELPKKEFPKEETLQPFSFEERKVDILEEVAAPEAPFEEKVKSLEKEEFPEELLGGVVEEEGLKEEELKGEEFKEEELKEEALEEEALKMEELKEEELKEEKLFEEELLEEGGLPEEELLEEEGLPEEEILEEEKPLEEEELEVIKAPKEEGIELFEGLEASKLIEEERKPIEKVREVRTERAPAFEAPGIFDTEFTPPLRKMDQQVEEVISEKVQGMMEELISKHVPEMTKEIVHLAIERIEKLVREIVPDLAEKIIEEEIKRLEKGERD